MKELEENIRTKDNLLKIEFLKFNSAKDGNGNNNFDMMADALENINMMLAYDCEKLKIVYVTKKIDRNIKIYRTIEYNPRYKIKTEDGFILKPSTEYKMNALLTKSMRVLWKIAERCNYL
jgi:hypothetical protein